MYFNHPPNLFTTRLLLNYQRFELFRLHEISIEPLSMYFRLPVYRLLLLPHELILFNATLEILLVFYFFAWIESLIPAVLNYSNTTKL